MTGFVGREHELAALIAGLENAFAGHGRLFLISGEPGIGKSRLADELSNRARERGADVLIGRCWEAGGAPAFWPWLQVARARVRERPPETVKAELGAGGRDLAQIVPDLAELFPDLSDLPSLDSEGSRFRLFDAVASFLRATSQHEPLVVVLDDLHAADEPSLLLLRFLARELGTSRLLVAATYRDVDPTLADPLTTALTELIREPVTRTISLRGLGEPEVARFIELATAHTPTAGLAATVHAETEGNPLFVGEIVRLLEAEGRLDAGGVEHLAIPQTVKEVIGRRVHRLSGECGRVLALASVLGRDFEVDTLARLSGLDLGALLDLLDEAIAARVVSGQSGTKGSMRFAHALIRDTLYEGLPTSRRPHLHRQAGEVLASLYAHDPEPYLAELAHHFLLAAPIGDANKAIRYARAAGERAARLAAFEEAARLYQLALELTEEGSSRCELLIAIGDVQARAGDTPAAKDTYRRAAKLADELSLPGLLAQAALGYGGRIIWEPSRDDDYLVPLLERALSALGGEDSRLRVMLLARLAAGPLRDPNFPPERKRDLSREALEVARRLGEPATLAYALAGYINAHHSPDFTVEQVELATELIRVADEAGDAERAVEGYENRLVALLELGEIERAKSDLEAMAALANELRQPAQRWYVAVDRAVVALLEGRLSDAEILIQEALAIGEQALGWHAALTYRVQLYVLRMQQGRLEEIEELIRRSAAEYSRYFAWRCFLPHMLLELGKPAEARTSFDQLAADDFAEVPFDDEWLVDMTLLAQVACGLSDTRSGAVLYDLLRPYADRVATTYTKDATGSVSRYLGLLASLLGRREDAHRHFADALAMNEQVGARGWLAHTQVDYARMLIARGVPGDSEQAAEHLRVALATCRELGMEPLATKARTLLSAHGVADAGTDAFAGYRIEGEIGRGGMGVVYRATDLQLERSVALKLIAPELASQEDFRKRFLRESRLAASLDHGNVIPIYEAGEQDGRLFLAMRYVEGSDLKALLGRQGTLPAERALSILGRVADALDAAHAKGLVHRDVKPGNVLLDERGHPYLTDFGLTKEAGGTSTQTGHIVGTLDYLAPEQIRGEEIDGRTDEYALACLLHECLAGKPPFRRPTEAEVLWAHMQEPPPHVRDYPALDPVLARALAKEKDQRYPSCGEFLAAAHAALGLEAPAVRHRRRRLGRRLLLAGAALVAAAGIAVAVVELTGGESSALAAPAPNSVVEIDPGRDKPVAQVAVGSNPTALALDGAAVWALNADDQTISRIDRKTKAQKTFSVGTTPTDLAAGEGSVWVGNGTESPRSVFIGPILSSVSRVDPDTFAVLGTSKLPTKGEGGAEGGVQGDSLVVGKGAIWAINPDLTISRLDPQSGKVVARVPTSVVEIAAGPNGVLWGLKPPPEPGLVRIDPRTNAVTATIRIGSEGLSDIAVGAGAVWVSDENGFVWRIDPGRRATQRTITVAKGVDSLAFGSGSLWAVNPFDGTISRIDPSTNAVAKTIAIGGTPRDVTAGEGSLWVSDAGASCGKPLYEGDGEPQYLVVSDLALRTPGAENPAMVKAIELVFRKREFRAGKYRVAYQSCDDSSSQIGIFDVPKCAANAKSYAAGASVIGVIGTYNSGCAQSEIPFLNKAPDGPLAMVSPANSYIGLTRRDPFAEKGELEALYPTGVRNYARVYPIDDVAGAGAALFLKRLGARRASGLTDRDGYSDLLVRSFRVTAGRIGLGFVGVSTFDPRAKSYSRLVARLKRARVDAVYIGGYLNLGNTGKLIKELRTQLGPRVQLVTGDGFLPVSNMLRALGPTARTLYVTVVGDVGEDRLPPAGRRFLKDFLATEGATKFNPFAMYAAQAAEVMLDAIAHSDGTRASVTRELMRTRVKSGILGTFRFDRNGDTTHQTVTILRPVGAAAKRDRLGVEGADVVRVIDVPPSLLP